MDLTDYLSELGMNSYEAAAYLALISRDGLTPAELAPMAKIPRQRVYDVLDSLSAKGFCTVRDGSPKTYFAVPPDVALEKFRQQRAEAMERERERLSRQSDSLLAQLIPIWETGRGQKNPLRYVETLTDPNRIAAQALSFARGATRSVNSCIRLPLILTPEQNWRFLREPLERGIIYRAIYEKSARQNSQLSEWMTAFREYGQEIRLVEHLPIKMQSFDDEATMLSLQDPVAGTPSFTAITIRHQGTVAFLNMAFEQLWQTGEPYDG
ncbi:MAG: TrmB family transcriptional regulator [Akkermansiaceae bacterium]|nr:TrmB family transcriptional regulator [Armatimonadota bacterium]